MQYHFIDDSLLIVEKPSGLLSVPGKAENNRDCVISRVLLEYPDAHIVHRLDLSTSGLMILARGLDAHRKISMGFEKRKIHKKYEALLHGLLEQDDGEIDAPLICDWPNRPRQKIDYEVGKPSLTKYKVLSRDEKTTRVEFTPITGRSHQIRVHSIHIGHPICGDYFYTKDEEYPRLCLHATYLEFNHPKSGEIVKFESKPEF